MFPILVIVIGIAVLVFGQRLARTRRGRGPPLRVGLAEPLLGVRRPCAAARRGRPLAVLGALVGGFAKDFVAIVILVMGALAGATIVLGFLDLFNVDLGLMRWLLAAVGGVAGFVLIRRSRKGSKTGGSSFWPASSARCSSLAGSPSCYRPCKASSPP